jgi:hypothetical protein
MTQVRQALRTAQAGEEAVAELAQEPATLPWVASPLARADELRRAGDKTLFEGQPAQWPQAGTRLLEAERLYADIRLRVDSLRKARAAAAQTRLYLPRLEPTWIAAGRLDAAEEKAWNETLLAAVPLCEALAPTQPLADPGSLLERALILRQRLTDLRRILDAKIQRGLTPPDDAGADSYREIQAVLASPLLDGPRREQLWRSGQKLALRLAKSTQSLDEADNRGKSAAAIALGPDRGPEHMQARRHWLARLARDRNALAGFPPQVRPEKLLQSFKASEAALEKAERLSQVLAPFDLAPLRSTEPAHWSQNPTLTRYRRDASAFWQWLAQRCRADAAAQREGSSHRALYTEAAEEYSRFAARMK